ncbi:MAG: DUF4118 domain-containing protein [Eubacteriales bacterium]|nr:DUF4118 domain-containing protein [Eubacteriales bacterium]
MTKKTASDGGFTVVVLAAAFFLNLLLDRWFETIALVPMIFVLGVFLISLKTQHLFWGIFGSFVSVLLVNYAFTYPYFGIDLVSPECIVSALVMLVVAVMTGTLTMQIRKTLQMKAEIEKESMRANLLRAVSHDLRTPLTTVYGSCSAIIDNFDSLDKAEQIKLLRGIQQDAQWLIRMVENLLSVTRIDAEGVQLKKTPTVLEEFIDTVLLKFKKRCPGTAVIADIPDTFVSIPMDAVLMEQVLMNLLENAVYHARGMTELRLCVTLKGSRAWFSVSDNGCGIEESILPHLFTGCLDRHTETSDSCRSNMGIGLSVCAAIVRAHGSTITAANQKTGGAVFRFSLETEAEDEA